MKPERLNHLGCESEGEGEGEAEGEDEDEGENESSARRPAISSAAKLNRT